MPSEAVSRTHRMVSVSPSPATGSGGTFGRRSWGRTRRCRAPGAHRHAGGGGAPRGRRATSRACNGPGGPAAPPRDTNGARCFLERRAAAGVAGCAREKGGGMDMGTAAPENLPRLWRKPSRRGGHHGAEPAADAPDEGRAEDVAAEGLAAGGAADEGRGVGPRDDLEEKVRRKRRRRGRGRVASLAWRHRLYVQVGSWDNKLRVARRHGFGGSSGVDRQTC
jgi:hypothetical protein